MDQPPQTFGAAQPPIDPPPMPGRRPDPGSGGAAKLAWVVLLMVLPLVVVMQQLQVHGEPEVDPSQIQPPQGDNVEVTARMATRMSYDFPAAAPNFEVQLDDAIEAADTPLQRFRGAIAYRELIDADRTIEELREVVSTLEGDADEYYDPADEDAQSRRTQLLADARTLLPYYQSVSENSEDAAALDDETLDGIIERHGFFGELVRVASLPQNHELREELLSGAIGPFIVVGGVMGLMGLAILAGLVLGIIALVMLGTGKVRLVMPRPAPGGSVYLETAVIFVLAFALLQIMQAIAALIGESAEMIAGLIALPAQWLLLLVPLWPLARGVSWSQVRDDLGLRAPRGVMVETVMGIAGYLAMLPIVIAGVAVMFVLLLLQERFFPADPDAMGPSNPILELARSLDPVLLIMIFTLATIWAPLCEELVFRGALFRHLRSRLALPIAAILSAMIFGMMHGYALIQLIPVTVLGFNFALIRAWRGSLVGPIAAHALNNAVVLTLLFAFAHAIYG